MWLDWRAEALAVVVVTQTGGGLQGVFAMVILNTYVWYCLKPTIMPWNETVCFKAAFPNLAPVLGILGVVVRHPWKHCVDREGSLEAWIC